MLILGQKKSGQDQSHLFQDKYSESYEIHQLDIMYNFEYIMVSL